MILRCCLVLSFLASLAFSTSTVAAVVYGNNVIGQLKHFDITDVNQEPISVAAGLAFDPTHTNGNGNYDRVYLANRTASNAKRGLYAIDIFNETTSARLALAGDDSNDLDSPTDVAINANGTAYVTFDLTPSIHKVVDPTGSAAESQLLGNYRDAGDDDPVAIAMVPSGFGGGFVAGSDIVVFDNGIDDNDSEGVTVIGAGSTAASPIATVIWEDLGGSDNGSLRGDTSSVDGYAYFMRSTIPSADLGGTTRLFVNRLKGDGVLERVFLNADVSSISDNLDDALTINPHDGALWFVTEDGGANSNFYRVDVANAINQGGGDFLADVTLEIAISDPDDYNVGVQSMAISPDGKHLAVGAPSGVDSMYVYQLVPEPPAWLLLGCAGLLLLGLQRRM